jgi:hypothetical protein
VNGLTEDATFQRVAIDAALGVGSAQKERNQKQGEPSQTAAHKTSLQAAEKV